MGGYELVLPQTNGGRGHPREQLVRTSTYRTLPNDFHCPIVTFAFLHVSEPLPQDVSIVTRCEGADGSKYISHLAVP